MAHSQGDAKRPNGGLRLTKAVRGNPAASVLSVSESCGNGFMRLRMDGRSGHGTSLRAIVLLPAIARLAQHGDCGQVALADISPPS